MRGLFKRVNVFLKEGAHMREFDEMDPQDFSANIQNMDGDTLLNELCRLEPSHKSRRLIKKLIRERSFVHTRFLTNTHGEAALHLAVKSYIGKETFPKSVKLLVNTCLVDVCIQNTDGDTALHLAVKNKIPEIVRILLNHDQRYLPNIKDNDGCTALHYAAYFNFPVGIEMLLWKGRADLGIQDMNGNTALHFAFMSSSMLGIHIKLLIKKGAKLDVQNNSGETPLDVVCIG